MDLEAARREFGQRLALTLGVALYSRDKARAGGTLLFMDGTGGRRPGVGMTVVAALAVHLMCNDALAGGPYDIDGGQQLLSR
ncbi:hypothetical protein WKI65_42670 [Streptomyces sp. MS1.AVA.3]|uniref:hypothetical protein n=1 Tax=Streptomyces decoyicus TaxID=249567 RepID=UPI0030C60B02